MQPLIGAGIASDSVQLLVAGIALGAIYALVALGFIMIYRATSVMNFAQGDMVTVGAFVGWWITQDLGLPILVGWLVAVPFLAILGAVTYFVYRPLRDRPFLVAAIGTLGLAIMMRTVLFLAFGPEERRLRSPVGSETIDLGGIVIGRHQLFIIAVTAVLVFLQAYVFKRTFLGKSLRATAEDQEVARLLGLRGNLLILGTFMYGAMLAALAGVLLAPLFFVSLGLGFSLMLKAFVGSIIGGFGSVGGALLGGVVVGLTEVFGARFISTAFRDSFAFALLILILLLRPAGILGKATQQKV